MMYIADGWGSVTSRSTCRAGRRTRSSGDSIGVDRAWAGDVASAASTIGVALWSKVISIALDGRIFALDRATG
jgi:hypothetical protein